MSMSMRSEHGQSSVAIVVMNNVVEKSFTVACDDSKISYDDPGCSSFAPRADRCNRDGGQGCSTPYKAGSGLVPSFGRPAGGPEPH